MNPLTPERKLFIGCLLLPFTVAYFALPVYDAYIAHGLSGGVTTSTTLVFAMLGPYLIYESADSVNLYLSGGGQ